jgi:hypothetical protein
VDQNTFFSPTPSWISQGHLYLLFVFSSTLQVAVCIKQKSASTKQTHNTLAPWLQDSNMLGLTDGMTQTVDSVL